MSDMSVIASGFLIGLSLIVAIGPQNALIIKQGIKREHVGAVIAVCLLSDVFLILGGTLGVGVLIEQAPLFLTALKWFGAAYLGYFAFTCFRDAAQSEGATVVAEEEPVGASASANGGAVGTLTQQRTRASRRTSWRKPVLAALAFTWLNPAAYIDALVMLGGIANQYGTEMRWYFAGGALLASTVWFPFLGTLSIKGAAVLRRPQVWRLVNIGIGFIMIYMTIKVITH